MHQKQPPPKSAISVLFVFIELVCASAEKFSAPTAIKKQIVCFIISILTSRTLFRSIAFRFVQMFARRKVGVFFKMFGAQRLGDRIFAAEPFAEVNQLAAFGAKGREFSGQPIAGFLARRTFDGGSFILFLMQSL
jgi:hypothetical protein